MAGFPKNKNGNRWKYPDRFDHERHIAYLRFVCQCRYRGEAIKITMKQWFEIWHDPAVWDRRGRGSNALCLMRLDPEKPWTKKNSVIIERAEQIRHAKRLYIEEHGHAPNLGSTYKSRQSRVEQ